MSSHEKVRASHVLIIHDGSRRKASWKDPEGSTISTTWDAVLPASLPSPGYRFWGRAVRGRRAKHFNCSSPSAGVTSVSFHLSELFFLGLRLRDLILVLCSSSFRENV
ncbi:peptidyl-prolyl cis-trans isomerase NIMA-interacting 1 [Iris pallida]|uniref:Peptidyl-prolyl cis-trans isomerase NIMA-interacting 1 n=1 Tax=Iris pallida TaxID=29817 RepID=A0AAX6HQ77_IRIPA|nr:peptidyl-prolyl cis-trans isomerase NIMA-interacting 1 [Iris pallida]